MQNRYETLFPATIAVSVLLMLLGVALDDPANILPGLYHIVTMQDLLITDYVHIAGVGATLINSGLVTIISILLIKLSDDTFNGFTLVEMGLMAGFSLFGKNILNIWPILLGTWLYAKYQKQPFGKHVSVGPLATSLSPLVSYMALGSVHASVHEGLVAGAAAQVAVLLEPVTDFFTGGSIVVVQQDLGGHDEAGGAEAALGAAMCHPGNLQGMHIGNGTDAFDGGDLSVLSDLAQLHDAGTGNLAVHNDVTGAAMTLAAADLTAGQQQTVPKEAGQSLVLAYQHGAGYTVDDECSLDHNTVSSF